MFLCLGPSGSGKTFLLKRLQVASVDDVGNTIETVGTNIIPIPKKPPVPKDKDKSKKSKSGDDYIGVREVGGPMAPLWPSYYAVAKFIIYVIDASNLFQISISTVMLMEMLSHEKLVQTKFLVVLAKVDLTTKKKLNYLKFMMRLDNIVSQMPKRITVQEISSLKGDGLENIRNWIVENAASASSLSLELQRTSRK